MIFQTMAHGGISVSHDPYSGHSGTSLINELRAHIMTDDHRTRIRQNRIQFVDDLNVVEVLDNLSQCNAITVEECQEVQSKETRQNQVRTLLDILPRRGELAFYAFSAALRKTQFHLYKLCKC